jgi:hypothetical protein
MKVGKLVLVKYNENFILQRKVFMVIDILIQINEKLQFYLNILNIP